MKINLARLDNRLLHGIVATQWVQHSKCERLMIIDDEVALDPTKKEIMRLAKPAGMPLSIITLETAINNFKAGKYDKKRIFVVTKKPSILEELVNNGIQIEEINLGGSAGEADEVVKINKRYSCSNEDKKCLDSLKEKGITIYAQYIPADMKECY